MIGERAPFRRRPIIIREAGSASMSLFQTDFWKDYIVVIVATIILGAGLAAGVAGALDVVLGEAVSGLLGEAGEFDLMVHVREQFVDAAADELYRRMAERHDDIFVRQGVSMAGNTTFFIKLPDEMRSQATLEQLAASLRDVPGFNGHSWLIEPSVTVSGLRPGMRDLLALEAASIPGVRAPVRHGTGITVVLESVEHQRAVTEALQERLAGHHLVEIRWPEGKAGAAADVTSAIAEALAPRTLRDVTARSATDSPMDELAQQLQEFLPLWERLLTAGSTAADAADKLVGLLDALEPALALTEGPDEQGERLSEAVRSGDGADAVREALIRVVAANLVRSLSGKASASPAAPSPDQASVDPAAASDGRPSLSEIEELRAGLSALAEDASALRNIDQANVLATIESLRSMLPAGGAGDGVVELFVDATIVPEDVARVVREATGDDVSVFVSSPGIVSPNPRGVVAELLLDVRRTIAGLVAVGVVLASLVLDHATVFAAAARLPGSRRYVRWLAAGVGALLTGLTYALAGGQIPLVGPVAATALGALLGLLVMAASGRLSPVNTDEMLAGQALGLSGGQIMREIVVPAGRPGLLTLLNGRRREFR